MALNGDARWRVARRRMVEEQLVSHGIQDERVLDAMGRLPRHLFLDPVLGPRAYSANALPIGGGQTISNPRVVAVMCEALALRGTERVLEIGAGCGYQTALLCMLAREVWSLERISELAQAAAQRLADLGLSNFHLRADPGLAWPEEAPFDAIVASAAAPEVPGRLLAQLGPRGRLVLPVGRETRQQLLLLVRHRDAVVTTSLGSCKFVPLLGPRPSAARQAGQGSGQPV